MADNILHFNIAVGKNKPETIINKAATCPFCEYVHLKNILAREGEFTLLENKYNVLSDAYQLVLLETRYCGKDIPDYTKEHLHALIRFGIRHWLAMWNSKLYQSVLFFKNYGFMSGGTMRHPHMQIIGLKTIPPEKLYEKYNFSGLNIAERNQVTFNISTTPLIGFHEFNVKMNLDLGGIDDFADFIQIAVRYIKNHYHQKDISYNIFFYKLSRHIVAKIMPRFPTSPLFIGYGLRICPDDLETVRAEIRRLYF